MSKWSKVSKGDGVELKGKVYEVVKIKHKGKRAKVTVRGAGGEFSAEVLLADKVKVVDADPLYDDEGRMRRWARPSEVHNAAKVAPGDPTITKPPKGKAERSGDEWETRRDKVERRLGEMLEAKLIGEADDENAGYYVPPVDITTIASHMALFHNVDTSQYGVDDLLELHGHEHHEAENLGTTLAVNHWHTKDRP